MCTFGAPDVFTSNVDVGWSRIGGARELSKISVEPGQRPSVSYVEARVVERLSVQFLTGAE